MIAVPRRTTGIYIELRKSKGKELWISVFVVVLVVVVVVRLLFLVISFFGGNERYVISNPGDFQSRLTSGSYDIDIRLVLIQLVTVGDRAQPQRWFQEI